MNGDLQKLIEDYRVQSASLSARDLYRLARSNGVSKFYATVLLRDLYGFNLAECFEVMRQCGEGPDANS